MNVTVDSLRALVANRSIVFDTATETVKNANLFQWAGTCCKTGASKIRNEATLQAIRQAIVTDPRYAGVRLQANEMLNEIRTDKNINSSRIQGILNRLDQLSTPAEQRKLLLERFSIHLANRKLPDEWRWKIDRINGYFERTAGTLIERAGSAANVNVAIEIQNVIRNLEDMVQVCRDDFGNLDNDAFEFISTIFAKQPQAIDSYEKLARTSDALKPILNELRNLDANPTTVNFGVRYMSHTQKVAVPGIFNALCDAVRQLLPNAEGAIAGIGEGGRNTASGLDKFLSTVYADLDGLINYPDGAEPNDPFEKYANVNFVFRQYAVSLPRHLQESLLDKLDSPEGRHLRLFYEDVGGLTAIDRHRAYDALVETLSQTLNRPVARLDTQEMHCDIMNVPPDVRAKFDPIDERYRHMCDIARMPAEFGLSAAEASWFENIAAALVVSGNRPATVAMHLRNPDSVPSRMLAYPALTGSVDIAKKTFELFVKFDSVYAQSNVNPNFKIAAEKFIFEELSSQVESGNSLPTLAKFEKSLKSPDSYIDFVKQWGFCTDITQTLLLMPVEFRKPSIDTLKVFCDSQDSQLFNRIVMHREALKTMHAEGRLTLQNAFRQITGHEAPFTKKTDSFTIKNYFSDTMYKAVEDFFLQFVDENGNLPDDIQSRQSAVYKVLAGYEISVEDAYAVVMQQREIQEGDKVIDNPFTPYFGLRIGQNVNDAVNVLARDLYRMNDSYSVDGVPARNVPGGNVYTFTFPDGRQEVLSSNPGNMAGDDLKNYRSGFPSSKTDTLLAMATRICGRHHKSQLEGLVLGLCQNAILPLRNLAIAHNVVANEHVPVHLDISKDEQGNVLLRVSQPENCPLEFNWTYTIAPNGMQTMSEVFMRRANAAQAVV